MQHHVTKRLPYSPDQLFALVGGVEAYPEFVPWITDMRVWNARTLGEGIESPFAGWLENWDSIGYEDPDITTQIDVGDWIELRSLPGGIKSKENSNRRAEQECDRDRI